MKTLLLLLVMLAAQARAVILSGPNGTGSGNATESSLTTFVTNNALPAFGFYNNVISVSDASGVYLGNNDGYGWVMTAAHVNQLTPGVSTITVGGTNYTVRSNNPVGAQDLRLYRIGGEVGDPALPALPNISIASFSPVLNQSFLTFGRGERAEGTLGSAASSDAQLAGNTSHYDWAGAGAVRWGINRVEPLPVWTGEFPNVFSTLGATDVFSSTFDDPGSGNYLTALEAGHAVGDSGGPLFTLQGGNWVLTGMTLAVGSDPALGQPGGMTGFGNLSVYADLATYKTVIEGIAIPEPSSLLSLAIAAMCLVGRRRREVS